MCTSLYPFSWLLPANGFILWSVSQRLLKDGIPYVDEAQLQRAWEILDKAWFEVDQILSSEPSGTALTSQEIEA